ncbi:chemotaxis protein CheD [Neobacillus sp. LXY-4]|uniref:chemotaxis protein CheD n=1 Tax=Neobacillus sp. LXY-4 TaxID=3379826 RepID=UPI003EE321D2
MMIKDRELPSIRVGIAGIETVTGAAILKTSGLGSCVGVVLFDQAEEVSGLAHVMLPNSKLAKAESHKKGKFADIAIQALVTSLISKGARLPNLKAKLAGGAEMFPGLASSSLMKVGLRNIEAVRQELAIRSIEVIAEEVGGSSGRSIEFNTKTYDLAIRTAHNRMYLI